MNQPGNRAGLSGILLVDKPMGITSHDVVARLRRALGEKRIGHIGTLDPMADGLLVVCIGPATRIAQFLVGLDKVYHGAITLGAVSSTYDAEGEIVKQKTQFTGSQADVAGAMALQSGRQIQLPPPYSAVKVRGKKLYQYARAGEAVPEKPRTVVIHRFEMQLYDPPRIHFEAKVGSGTYIRSMAHNLGAALGCGAFLSRLRRTHIGGYAVDDALPLTAIEQGPEMALGRLLSLSEALGHLPRVTIHERVLAPIQHGGAFTTEDILEFDGILVPGQPVVVVDESGRVLSIAQPTAARGRRGEDDEEEDAVHPALGAASLLFRPMRVLDAS